MTAATIAFGLGVFRSVLRVDLLGAMRRVHSGGEYDIVVRLLDNAWKAIAGVVTWIALWVIVWIPWQVLSAVFRSPNPHLSRAIADVGGALATFVVVGLCLYIARMAVALTLAGRESRWARGRVDEGVSGRRVLSTPKPSVSERLAVAVTTPTDFDFLLAGLVGALVLLLLIGHAHAQGFPL